MLQYPISLLSASALIEGGIEALVAFYESDIELSEGRDLDEEEIVSLEDKAHIAFAGVIEDIKDLMGISKVHLPSPVSSSFPVDLLISGGLENLSGVDSGGAGQRYSDFLSVGQKLSLEQFICGCR